MAECEPQHPIAGGYLQPKPMLQVVGLVHNDQIEHRQRAAHRPRQVVLVVSVERVVGQPRQYRAHVIARLRPRLVVSLERQAEAGEPCEEVAIGVEGRLVQEDVQVAALDERPRRLVGQPANPKIRNADVARREVA
jgi:hypothetical protein